MNVYKYSLLRYKPSVQREEFINIGLIFHSSNDKFLEFKLTTDWNRVRVFSGKSNIDLLKESAEGIFNMINQNQLIKEKRFDYSDVKLLERITRSLSGQLFFSSIRESHAENSPHYTSKYLYQINVSVRNIPTYHKEDQFDVKKAVRNILLDVTKKAFTLETHIEGLIRHDFLEYDFITKDKLFKSISFINKDMKKLKQTIKAFTLDSIEMKKNGGYTSYLIYANADNQYEINDYLVEIGKYRQLFSTKSNNRELEEKIQSLEREITDLKMQNNYLEDYFELLKRNSVKLINLHDFEKFVSDNKEKLLEGLQNFDEFLSKSFHS